jgi:hypothetical protein
LDILFLCHRIPYPPNKGDKIRSHALLKHHAQNHRVHVACFVDDPADMEYAQDVRRLAGGSFIRLTGASSSFGGVGDGFGPVRDGTYFAAANRRVDQDHSRQHSIRRTVVFCWQRLCAQQRNVDVRHAILDLVDIDPTNGANMR